jgi:hypothetical protein
MKYMQREWIPLCLKENPDPFGTTANGYLTPCCFCDTYGRDISNYDPLWNALFDEELKLENNDSINDIILSDQWKRFFMAIAAGPNMAPKLCQRICWRENPIVVAI